MRNLRMILALLAVLVCGSAARGQCTTSPNLQFQIPNIGNTTTWGGCLNNDLLLIDTLLGGTASLQIASATPSVQGFSNWVTANTSSVVISNFLNGFPGQTIRVFCGPGDVFTQMVSNVTISLRSAWGCSTSTAISLTLIGSVWTENSRLGTTGAQTNVQNIFTAPQQFDADVHFKGPNPWLDITRFGGYLGTVTPGAATTCNMVASTFVASCAAASDFQNGQGVVILRAGPAPVIATPQAPTVTPWFQVGSTTRTYCVADRDWAGGLTPCSAVGSTSIAPASMTLQTYSISSWSFNTSTGLFTVTTSAPHNMPTTSTGVPSEPYAQIEIQFGTTNNSQCEGAFSVTAVPSGTTFQFPRNDLTSRGGPSPACTGGTVRIAPKIILKWDSHYTYAVQSATCSGGTATVTVSPSIFGPSSAAYNWIVPWFTPAIFSGLLDTHYNGTFRPANFAPTGPSPNSVQYSIGSCSGVSNVGAGGTMTLVPGRAVKNHLIYVCTTPGACSLPTNAANFSFAGTATGNDGYFIDRGWSASVASVDIGDAPTTAPTAATNQYLNTTILTGGGSSSLTLAAAATNSVSGAKIYHDNVPNLLAACSAIAQNVTGANTGTIVIPAASAIYNYFPIVANFDPYGQFGANPRNCNGLSFEFHSTIYAQGTMLLYGKFTAGQGGTNCVASFWASQNALACVTGTAFPMVYGEPEVSGSAYIENMVLKPTQAYQSGLYLDEEVNGDGVAGLSLRGTHVDGGPTSYSVVHKAGFGIDWAGGGWSSQTGDFSQNRAYTMTYLCGMTNYLPPTPFFPYLFTSNRSYSFGTFEVSSCGLGGGVFGNGVQFNNLLVENNPGPAFKFNMFPYGLSGVSFINLVNADPTGGFATPLFDLVNATASGSVFDFPECSTGVSPLAQTSTSATSYGGNMVRVASGGCVPNGGAGLMGGFILDNMAQSQRTLNNYAYWVGAGSSIGSGLIANPSVAPTVAATTSGCGGFPTAGTYIYYVSFLDAAGQPYPATGHETLLSPVSSNVTVDGVTQCVQITEPVPVVGAVYWRVYRDQVPAVGITLASNNGVNSLVPITTTTWLDARNFTTGLGPPATDTAVLHVLTPSGFNGGMTATTLGSEQNCSSTASPAVCNSAIMGSFVLPAGATTITVNTTAVTANSQIDPAEDSSLGTRLSVTCNTTIGRTYVVTGRVPGVSFTITASAAPTTNPACLSFSVFN
jgi:hypothetical protein